MLLVLPRPLFGYLFPKNPFLFVLQAFMHYTWPNMIDNRYVMFNYLQKSTVWNENTGLEIGLKNIGCSSQM